MAKPNVTREAVSELREGLAHRLSPILEAAHQLADLQRVHAALASAAIHDRELAHRISGVCPTWMNPGSGDADNEVLHELLRVACAELGELVARASALAEGGAA